MDELTEKIKGIYSKIVEKYEDDMMHFSGGERSREEYLRGIRNGMTRISRLSLNLLKKEFPDIDFDDQGWGKNLVELTEEDINFFIDGLKSFGGYECIDEAKRSFIKNIHPKLTQEEVEYAKSYPTNYFNTLLNDDPEKIRVMRTEWKKE